MRRERGNRTDRLTRQQLLAETLFTTVLEGDGDEGASVECGSGAALGSAVIDSVCAYLGHPRHCPHGRPIPLGPCCKKSQRVLEPLVRPLTNLAPGDEARIVYIVPTDADQLVRLSNLGLVPGANVRLQQRRPAFVLSLGETSLALDGEVGRDIYVRKVEEDS